MHYKRLATRGISVCVSMMMFFVKSVPVTADNMIDRQDAEKGVVNSTEQKEQYSSNAQLIQSQTIVQVPVVEEDFRFVTVEKLYGVTKADKVFVYEEKSDEARVVGTLLQGDICYRLKEEKEWIYIESGVVRGFVKAEAIFFGEEVKGIVEKKEQLSSVKEITTEPQREKSLQKKRNGILKKSISLLELSGNTKDAVSFAELQMEDDLELQMEIEAEEELLDKLRGSVLNFAKAKIEPIENRALAYTKTTTGQTVVEKQYAIAAEDINIYTGKASNVPVSGTLEAGGLCYILADEEEAYIFVESANVRGFVEKEKITKVETVEEASLALAKEVIEWQKNPVLYYTFTSIKQGEDFTSIRESILDFADQFVGNTYRWGGTSLTNGADCSGFVQSIYRHYGYYLPRAAREQAYYGTKIPVEDAMPGDLIFYAQNGEIYHVAIYAGEGKTIEAQNTKVGIVRGRIDTAHAIWATRFIEDTAIDDVTIINAKIEVPLRGRVHQMAAEWKMGEFLDNDV